MHAEKDLDIISPCVDEKMFYRTLPVNKSDKNLRIIFV
jgi:hypothetical protein